MGVKSILVGLVPIAAMVIVESLDVGLSTLTKAAMSKGMSRFVFVSYSYALATLLLLPSLYFHRSKRPPLTFSLLCKFFILSLLGIVMQNCLYTGLNYSSPTLTSALGNLIPAFTFLLAVIIRIEKLDLRSLRSHVKVMGTLVSIIGALVIVLYQGPSIGSDLTTNSITNTNWIVGGLFISMACLCVAISNTLQAAILRGYPSEMTIVAFMCLFGTILSTLVSIIVEKAQPRAWILGSDIELFSVIYAAVIGNGISGCVQMWCLHKKGPIFVAMFKPLGNATAAFMSVIFLGDTLHVGSIVGAIVIIIGFYGVVWAQSKEEEEEEDADKMLPSSSHKTPLLQNMSLA